MIDVRDEPPGGPAARLLWGMYLDDIRERLGREFVPTEGIFATEEAFRGEGSAWLVLYEDGVPVGCGGLRALGPGVAEIKRMFVTSAARRRGHGRRLLSELERRARDAGRTRVRLYTTEALHEARVFYEAEGYRVVEEALENGRRDFWMERTLG